MKLHMNALKKTDPGRDGLAELLFSRYRRRALELLLLHPDKAYHVREIARLTGTVAGTLHKELSRLAVVGILTKTVRGNQVSYQANLECVIFDELASILRKTTGLAMVLLDSLAPLQEQIEVALVFGSMASGKVGPHSDIDLLILGEVAFRDVVKQLSTAEPTLGREINPKLFTRTQWQREVRRKSAFANAVMSSPTIPILGGRDDLG